VSRLALAVFCLCLASPIQAADLATCLYALDGDTIFVEVTGGHRLTVRLIGIDAPETNQEWGQEAKEFAQTWCAGGPFVLEYDLERTDRYRRTLAYAWRDGHLFNEQIVRAGLAIAVYYRPNGKHLERLELAQGEAELFAVGFWEQGGLDKTPADWRSSDRATPEQE
jgi:micrococcal nuclease